jgi:hypothetical protein
LLVVDPSPGSSQNAGRSGQRDAESSGKMQSTKGTQSSGGKVDPMDPPSIPSSGSNLRMQQNSGGTLTNPESNRTQQGGIDPLSAGNTVDPSKGSNPTSR